VECVLQWLDELEDLYFCLPLLWRRLRGWLLILLAGLAFATLLPLSPALALVPSCALLLGLFAGWLPLPNRGLKIRF
jgi:hypothetical protein